MLASRSETYSGGEPGHKRAGTRVVLQLAWGIIWRLTLRGFIAGTVLGLVYGCAVVFLAGAIYGVLFGAIYGVGTGLLSGIIMAAIMLALLPRLRMTWRNSKVLAAVPVGVILTLEILLIISRVAYDASYSTYSGGLMDFLAQEWASQQVGNWQLSMYYLPGIVAIVPAWYAGGQVGEWVAYQFARLR
jgi:hypothetical protein